MEKHSRLAITAMHNSALHNTFVQKITFQLWNLDIEEGNYFITMEDLECCINAALVGLAMQYGFTTEDAEERLNRVAPTLINQALRDTGLLVTNEPEADPEPEKDYDFPLVTDDYADNFPFVNDVEPRNPLLELLVQPDIYSDEEPPEDDCFTELLWLPSRCCVGICDLFNSMLEPLYLTKL